jgi:rhodanese-related sulfurtransferase
MKKGEPMSSPWKEITPRDLQERLEAGETPLLLDVRTAPEVAACHLPRIVWIPMSDLPFRYSELDADREIVVLCEHGVRSVRVCQFLADQGYRKLVNMTGGMSGWTGPTETGLEPLPSP